MLGTNDYKIQNARNIKELKNGMNKLLTKINNKKNIKKILIISPILLSENISNLDKEFDYNSYLLSTNGSKVYGQLASDYNTLYLDAKIIAKAGSDGEHFDEVSHIRLANKLIEIIENI